MITREQIAEVLRNRKGEDGISEVKIDPDGSVLAKLENRFGRNQPYTLTVHPIVEDRTLRIRIPLVAGERQGSGIPGVLASANICLAGGRLAIDSKNGIAFEVNHVCQGDGDNDLSAELLGQLLDAMVRDFRRIEMLILYAQRLAQASQDIVSTMS